MLSYFPIPYPDELWYSVLCRYHVRSGNISDIYTMKELFGNTSKYMSVGSFFPNNSIYYIYKQLPDTIFNIDEIILNHTLFNYFCRMRTYEEKIKMIEMIKKGNSKIPISYWRTSTKKNNTLKFCPICKKEDNEKYGESYWHCSHQIPLISICKKHKCRLITLEYSRNDTINESFILPDNCKSASSFDFNCNEYELFLTNVLYDYLHLSLDIGPTEGYNNLYQALLDSEYGITYKLENRSFNVAKIYKQLANNLGSEITIRVLGTNPKYCTFSVLKDWSLKCPERYAIVAALINQPANITFGQEIKNDNYNKQLKLKGDKRLVELEVNLIKFKKEAKEKGIIYKKKLIANKLGISTQQLDLLSRIIGIEPFWSHITGEKRSKVSCYLSYKEKQLVEEYTNKHDYANVSEFIRYCIKRVID
ncbi:TniQ family protein [Lacrimispora amygdalina]|uniref:TniQ family protein n=1 Tax=Lacrimispora amygdalina TaxID=253257 RepID=UPI000BE336F6|nr:TniQ family protein [Lacrimispora amygdalina]